MGDFVANEDMTVNFTNTAPGGLVYGGDLPIDVVKVVPVKATKVKMNSKFACIQNITLTWVPPQCAFTYPGHTFNSGSGSVTADAAKSTIETQAPLCENDPGTCAGSWTNISSGSPVPCTCNVKIMTAGQDKVRGD